MPIHPHVGTNSGSIQGLVARDNDLDRRLRALEANRTTLGAGSVTSTIIGPGSINTGHIQASAINASHISALSINASHIQALSIETGHIAALAVTAEKIAANAIEADKIAASAVTTVKLDAGAVTAAKIAADTITAAQIAANAITASEIAADAVTATKIAANAVVAGKIAADAVTAATIAANSITSDKILAGAVTSSKITVTDLAAISTNMGNITAGTITGGTVQTAASGSRVVMDSTGLKGYALDGVTKVFEINAGSGLASFTGTATIQAGSVVPGSTISGTIPSASVPAIGGGNLLPDSSLEGSNASGYWSAWDGSTITPVIDATTAKYGTKSMTRVATGGNLIYFWRASTGVPVTPGERVTVSGWFKGPAGTSFVVGFRAYNGVTMLGDSVGTAVAMDGTWKRVTATLTIPATTTDIRYISRTTANATAGQQFWADALQMEYGEVATAYAPMVSEILPGTIVTSYLADGAVTTGKITDGTITTAKIGTSQITNTLIADGSISTAKLQANSVTANEIAAGAITANKLNVTVGGGNLQSDSSFESSIAAWQISTASSSLTQDATKYRTGTKSLRFVATGAGARVRLSNANLIPVTPSTPYVISAYVRSDSAAGRNAQAVAVFFEATKTTATTLTPATSVAITTTGWTRVTYAVTSPADAAWLSCAPQIVNSLNGEAYYVDDVQVEIGDVATAYAPMTAEILPGTIVASMIAADTITASQIAADAISSNELASNAVIAGKISAGAINAANLFVDGVITASKIETGTITATQIGTGAITSNVIAAGAITAQKLSLTAGGGNLIAESSFENVGTPGTLPPGIVIQGTGTTTFPNDGTAYHGTRYLRHVWTGTGILKICAAPVYCRAGVTYAASLYVRGVSAGGISSVYQFTSTTSQDGSTGYVDGGTTLVAVSTPTLSTSWQRYTATFTVATDRWVQTGVRFANVAAGDWAEIDAIQVEEGSTHTAYNHRLPGSLGPTQILPESITSNQIMARTIQAGDIATGTITANEILAGTITADKLNVGVASSNQVVNSSFENSTSYATGWTLVNATGVVESTIVHGTGKSAKVTPTIASGHIHIASGSRPTCDPGQAITASAWVYVGSAVTIRIGIRTYDAVTGGSATGSTSYTDVAVPANTWTRITTTRAGAAVPAGTKAYDIYVQRNTDTTVFYVDDVQGQVGDLVTAYSPKADEVLPGTIQAQHLSVATLDAISANMGNLTAGTITGATVRTAASGARVELSASDFTLHGSEQQLAQYPYFVNESGYWALIRSAWGTATWANQIGYTVGDDFLPGPSFAPVALPVGVAPGDILTAARIKDITSANVTSGAEIIQTIRVNPSTSYKVGGKLIASRVTTASPAITVTMEWLDSSDNVLSTSTPTPTPSTLSRIAGGVDLQQWNLITNPSAEVDTSGWTSTGTTLTRDNAWASVGTYSLRTTKASVTNNDVSLYSHYVPWEAGAYLSARAVIKAHNAFGGSAQVGIEWWDATSLLSTTFHTLAGGLAAGATYTFSPASAAPANTTRFRLRLAAATSGTQNVDVAWDAIRASGGAITGYADGNTSGWNWTGTAGASTSTGYSAVSNDWTSFSATATSHASAAKLRFKVHVASATGDSSHETHFYGMYAVAAGSTYAAYKLNPADGSVLATSRLDSLATENVQSIAWRDLSAPAGELAGSISGESGGVGETGWLSNYTALNADALVPSTFNSPLGNRGAKAKLRAVDPRRPSENYAYLESVVSENNTGTQSNSLAAYVGTDAGQSSRVILGREETGASYSDFAFVEHVHPGETLYDGASGGGNQYVAPNTAHVIKNVSGGSTNLGASMEMSGGETWLLGGQVLFRADSANWTHTFAMISLYTTGGTLIEANFIGSFGASHTGIDPTYGTPWVTLCMSPRTLVVTAGQTWIPRVTITPTAYGIYVHHNYMHTFLHAVRIDHGNGY